MRILFQTITCIWLFQVSLSGTNPINPTKQSPYFEIKTEAVPAESFPLLSTTVVSHITGPIADVELRQRYRNDGNVAIEAVYVFPGSTRAAVYAMEMKIGNRTITANIQEKEKARQEYNQAKQEGKRTSLLEQDRPNVFTMNVANILPGETIDLILRYNEFLVPEKGSYSFVFPSVVGPRYSNGANTPEFVSNTSYLSEGTTIPYNLDITVNVNSPVPIIEAKSPSHTILKTKINQKKLHVEISAEERSRGNKDFIFNYRLSDNDIVSGTTFYDHGDEKFFLSIIEPPQKPDAKTIAPKEYVFIIDVSGSMHGFPIETSKVLMKNLLNTMTEEDFFNIILFAGDSRMLSPTPLQVNPQNITNAMNVLNEQRGAGGTELLRAVKKAMAAPKPYQNTSRSLVIITDGYIHVEAQCFDYIQDHLGEANFFAFGIGSSVNRHLIEGIAHVGRGESFVVTDKTHALKTAQLFGEYIQTPVLTNIDLCFNDFAAYDFMPRHIPDLMAERPIYIFGKYKGDIEGSISLSGTTGNGTYTHNIALQNEEEDKNNTALRYLWAREKLIYLSDYESLQPNEKYKDKIVAIGLQYSLLSNYTSFIAIDEQVVTNGQSATVNQPLPLPQGVSQHAIGFEMSAEAVVNHNVHMQEEILFVHIEEGLTEKQKQVVRDFMSMQLSTMDEEAKDLLDGNPLTIEVNIIDGIVSIQDHFQILDEDQIKIIEIHLNDLVNVLHESVAFKTTLLWL